MEACLAARHHVLRNLELHLLLLQYRLPHYHSFLFKHHATHRSFSEFQFVFNKVKHHPPHKQKFFPTRIFRKDRFYANTVIRRCSYLGRISEVDSTVAADSNCKAYVTCE